MKYGFIGCGNMGSALARSLSRATKDIMLSDSLKEKAQLLGEELGCRYADNTTVASECERIFLGVKPQMMAGMLDSIRVGLTIKKPLLITMAAGLETVPCILRDADYADSAELAIIENLQREDLSMFEEAEAIRSLLTTCGLTQESAAARLSCSQSYVANKLRLLKLPERQRRHILEGGLTERHARALLRLSSDEERDEIIEIIVKRHMNVAAAEEYIENYLCARERDRLREKADRLDRDFKRKLLSKDMRLFYNSIDRAVDSVRSCGIGIETNRRITDEGTVIEILVKNRA